MFLCSICRVISRRTAHGVGALRSIGRTFCSDTGQKLPSSYGKQSANVILPFSMGGFLHFVYYESSITFFFLVHYLLLCTSIHVDLTWTLSSSSNFKYMMEHEQYH